MDFEEKTISSQEIFKGRVVRLRVDTVTLPDGRQSTREIIDHNGAVAIIAIDAEDNILMVRQYRKALEQVLLEIPAGTLEVGEDPLVCAQRELREETGYSAGKWQKILSYYSAPGFANEELHVFLATELGSGEVEPDEDEFIEAEFIPLQQAYQSIFTGDIKDSKSIIGIQYAVSQGFGQPRHE